MKVYCSTVPFSLMIRGEVSVLQKTETVLLKNPISSALYVIFIFIE